MPKNVAIKELSYGLGSRCASRIRYHRFSSSFHPDWWEKMKTCKVLLKFHWFSRELFPASSNKFNTNSVHKTKEAKETKADLYCFSCDFMSDDENCVNINRTRQLNLTKKCDSDQSYCVVKRFSYTTSDKNSTSDKKLWSLQRDCTEKCENGCIVIGERVKLYACSACCGNNLCNISNSAVNFTSTLATTFVLVLALLTVFFFHSWNLHKRTNWQLFFFVFCDF